MITAPNSVKTRSQSPSSIGSLLLPYTSAGRLIISKLPSSHTPKSPKISPQIIRLNNNYEKFLLCTDGFRNKITEDEIFNIITNTYICDESDINNMLKRLTELNMLRGESDNISAVYIIKKNLETHYG